MSELADELGGHGPGSRVWIVMEVAQGWFQDEGGSGRACAAFAAVTGQGVEAPGSRAPVPQAVPDRDHCTAATHFCRLFGMRHADACAGPSMNCGVMVRLSCRQVSVRTSGGGCPREGDWVS
jgi:hypothetical protein